MHINVDARSSKFGDKNHSKTSESIREYKYKVDESKREVVDKS